MDSDLIPPSKSSNSPASDQAHTGEQATTSPGMSLSPTETGSSGNFSNRQEPIPPPSEPLQYRAIGLVRGRYNASAEQITIGTLIATDGTELDAVLLGRIMSLVKNHLDLKQEHLWVVYPRTRQQDSNLHLQITGVWEPENLSRLPATMRPEPEEKVEEHNLANVDTEESNLNSSPETEDGYFSIRGEVVYQSAPDKHFIVKIKQAPRKEFDQPKYFKLKLQGILPTKAVGQFWDLQAKRQANSLVLQQGKEITVLPSKPKLRSNKSRSSGYLGKKRNLDTPHPIRKLGESKSVTRPVPKSPIPRPIKRQKPPQ